MDQKRLWTCGVGALLIMGTAWFIASLFDSHAWKSAMIAEVEEILDEHRQLRRAEFQSTEWAEFQEEAEQRLNEMASDLENRWVRKWMAAR